MEATLLRQRLADAISAERPIVLLLRGAHTIEIERASMNRSDASGQTRFDIEGQIGIDRSPTRLGAVSVTSNDVASLFAENQVEHQVEHQKKSP